MFFCQEDNNPLLVNHLDSNWNFISDETIVFDDSVCKAGERKKRMFKIYFSVNFELTGSKMTFNPERFSLIVLELRGELLLKALVLKMINYLNQSKQLLMAKWAKLQHLFYF